MDAAAVPWREAGKESVKESRRKRYDAQPKARLTLALQVKSGVEELAQCHVVPPEVLHRWRREALLPIQWAAKGLLSQLEKLHKENHHLRSELKNALLERDFIEEAFGKLDLLDANR